jgi:hypothetical protein
MAQKTSQSTTTVSQCAQRYSIEDFIIIWLDSNVNEMNDLISQLFRFVNSVRTFSEPDSCVDYLTDAHEQMIFLILSDAFIDTLVPFIHDVHQLDSVYIFSDQKLNAKS